MTLFKPEGTKFLEWESSSLSSKQKQTLENPVNGAADKECYIPAFLPGIGNSSAKEKSTQPQLSKAQTCSPTQKVYTLMWLSSSQLSEKDMEAGEQLAWPWS